MSKQKSQKSVITWIVLGTIAIAVLFVGWSTWQTLSAPTQNEQILDQLNESLED